VADPETRTAAAELLHGAVVLVIGTGATDPAYTPQHAGSDATPHSPFYRMALPVCVSLAVCADPVCRALFETLLLQVCVCVCACVCVCVRVCVCVHGYGQ
jgi:hypothetical protein